MNAIDLTLTDDEEAQEVVVSAVANPVNLLSPNQIKREDEDKEDVMILNARHDKSTSPLSRSSPLQPSDIVGPTTFQSPTSLPTSSSSRDSSMDGCASKSSSDLNATDESKSRSIQSTPSTGPSPPVGASKDTQEAVQATTVPNNIEVATGAESRQNEIPSQASTSSQDKSTSSFSQLSNKQANGPTSSPGSPLTTPQNAVAVQQALGPENQKKPSPASPTADSPSKLSHQLCKSGLGDRLGDPSSATNDSALLPQSNVQRTNVAPISEKQAAPTCVPSEMNTSLENDITSQQRLDSQESEEESSVGATTTSTTPQLQLSRKLHRFQTSGGTIANPPWENKHRDKRVARKTTLMAASQGRPSKILNSGNEGSPEGNAESTINDKGADAETSESEKLCSIVKESRTVPTSQHSNNETFAEPGIASDKHSTDEDTGNAKDGGVTEAHEESREAPLYCMPVGGVNGPSAGSSEDVDFVEDNRRDYTYVVDSRTASSRTIARKETPGRAFRCRDCDGCKQEKCGLCIRCKPQSSTAGTRPCVFRPCRKFSKTTLITYRKLASECVDKHRREDGLLDDLYDKFYGEQGWATKRIDEVHGSEEYHDNWHEEYQPRSATLRSDTAFQSESREAVDESLSIAIAREEEKKKKRCGTCERCIRQKCGMCPTCRGQVQNGYSCVFNLCLNFKYAECTFRLYKRLAHKAVIENDESNRVHELYKEVYGEQDKKTHQPEATTEMKAPQKQIAGHRGGFGRGRCGTCEGCMRKCLFCPACRGRNYGSISCAFSLCSNYTYRPTTLANYQRLADQTMRENSDSTEVSELYKTVYGKQVKRTQRPESKADTIALTKIAKKGTGGRCIPCGKCEGCVRRCGCCIVCRGEGYGTIACAFSLCSNVTYAPGTLATRQKLAGKTVLENGDSFVIRELYENVYGESPARDGQASRSTESLPKSSKLPEGTVKTKKRKPTRCATCDGCTRERCMLCPPCQGNGRGNSSCAFKLCSNMPYATSTLKIYLAHANVAIRNNKRSELLNTLFESLYGEDGWASKLIETERSLPKDQDKPVFYHVKEVCVGDKVYARWPKTESWYWGNVRSVKRQSGRYLYHIRFDDGDEREDTPENELYTLEEYNDSQQPDDQPRERKRRRQSQNASSIEEFAEEAQRSQSRNLNVGSRCYAKFSNGGWYWGHVSAVKRGGNMFNVAFDDGDHLDGIVSFSIVSEQEYFDNFGELSPPTPGRGKRQKKGPEKFRGLSPCELRKKRCKNCAMCSKRDCGLCLSCRSNSRQTSTSKECCLQKMCSRLSSEQKQQPLSGLFSGWKYYFEDPNSSDETLPLSTQPAHPDLSGLVLVGPSGVKFHSLERAAMSLGLAKSSNALKEAELAFYRQTLGVKMLTDVTSHGLLGKGFHRKWRDCHGEIKDVYGTITKCRKSMFDGSLVFTVSYNAKSRSNLKPFALFQKNIPSENDQIAEEDALAGYVSFAKVTGEIVNLEEATFHRKYIVPDTRFENRFNSNGLPVLNIDVKGFNLELEARQSEIPNGGLGLWLKCTPISPLKREYFELKPGELLDLSVYAPLKQSDLKQNHISLLKNFVYSGRCEGWSFDPPPSYDTALGDVLDITDDQTGDLHERARKNIVVYANETDGNKETPSIYASYDPEGALHYFLGHPSADLPPFRILANGESKELKIDYGEPYEPVRIRKGYSRLKGKQLEAKQELMSEDDTGFIRDMHEASVNEIRESVDFLQHAFSSTAGDVESLVRALVATLTLQQRLAEICRMFDISDDDENDDDSICDNGYSTVKEETYHRLGLLIAHLCSLFPRGENQLRSELCSTELYCSVLTKSLQVDHQEAENLNPHELRRRIEALCSDLESC